MADKNSAGPVADIALEPYWEAARNGSLLLKKCDDCAKAHYYPRPICPFCMSANTSWIEASGQATIYSWSVERRAAEPYAIAFVSLPEGPAMLTNIVNADLDGLAIGQKVTLSFDIRDEQPVPVFSPA
jgi:uncharacterized OB-fold protein